MRIDQMRLYRVELPLTVPYKLSYRTFETFEPLLVEAICGDGGTGWGEQHISPGSSGETREGGWAFANAMAERITGLHVESAIDLVNAEATRSKVAATAIVTALEMLNGADVLAGAQEMRLPLLTPFNAGDPIAIAEEVEQRLEQGFRTFKVKVGQDVRADLKRVEAIQTAASGRARLRMDANRAYSRADGIAFASSIEPEGIELFEQPCAAEDWDANAAVAAASRVPLMLDEPICAMEDIDRAARIEGVGYCKLKLKRFGSLAGLEASLRHVKALGMDAVLGDGLGAEINCWMEACVAQRTIDNAGEFNGYLKVRPEARLLADPLPFEDGHMVVPAGFRPEIDRQRLRAHTLQEAHYLHPTAMRSSLPAR